MDFTGTGLRLQRADIEAAARRLGCDVPAIKAVLSVEAAGSGWDSANRPKALFEPHLFWGALPEQLRQTAVDAGLAYPHWRAGNYPRTSDGVYDQIARASAIHEEAALTACSWGIGQVLGSNHTIVGFRDVFGMVEAARRSEADQFGMMVEFVRFCGLAPALAAHDWARFARGYNGPAYKTNRYDSRLAAAWAATAKDEHYEADPLRDGVLMLGDKGEAVRAAQVAMQLAGYGIRADGDFGRLTQDAVRSFQRAKRLGDDGIIGPKTGKALGLHYWD